MAEFSVETECKLCQTPEPETARPMRRNCISGCFYDFTLPISREL